MNSAITGHPLWHDALPAEIEWCRCKSCSHVFTKHYWDDEGLKQVFSKSNDEQIASGVTHSLRHLWSLSVDRAVNLLGGYAQIKKLFANPSWLDVGFGNGLLVMSAAEYGFNSVGLDVRLETVEQLRQLGYKAVKTQFDHYEGEKFSVISMCDVLEHLPYPRASLKKARSLLQDNGLLMLSMPNSDSSHWRVMDQQRGNPYWIEIEHYHNFSRESLSKLLEEEGFQVVDYCVSNRYIACMEMFAKPI